MNKERMIKIHKFLNRLKSIDETIHELYNIEEDALEKLPESLLCGPRGDIMQELISCLDEAGDCLDNAIDEIESIYEHVPDRVLAYLYPWGHLKVGDNVFHGRFGKGVVVKKDKKNIWVEFDEKTSKFIFPDCFIQEYLSVEE